MRRCFPLVLALVALPSSTQAAPPRLDVLNEHGVDWLARSIGSGGLKGGRTEDVARALLPFTGVGSTHRYGPYKRTVKGLLDQLKRRVDRRDGRVVDHASRMNQILALAALSELYFVTKDPFLKGYCEPLLKALLRAQEGSGGFAAAAGKQADVRTTVWAMVALKNAKLSALFLPNDRLAAVRGFLEAATPDAQDSDKAGIYLTRLFSGTRRSDPSLRSLAEGFPAFDGLTAEECFFRLYAAFQQGDVARYNADRRAFEARLATLLHTKPGPNLGSAKGQAALRDTCFMLMAMQVHYRYERANGGGYDTPKEFLAKAARTVKAYRKVPSGERKELTDAISRATMPRFAKGVTEATDYLCKHAKLARKVVGEMLTKTTGPCASLMVKREALLLLKKIRTIPPPPKGPGPHPVKIIREGFSAPTAKYLVRFLKTNPPYPFASEVVAYLGQRYEVDTKGFSPSTPYADRVRLYKALEEARELFLERRKKEKKKG